MKEMEDSWRQNDLIKKVNQRQISYSSSKNDDDHEEQRLVREKWALKKVTKF
jgi:hypothetical protein